MVFIRELPHHEVAEIIDTKHFDASSTGLSLEPGKNRISEINLFLKSLLSVEVKVSLTINDFRLRSNLTTKKSKRFTEKWFFILY